MLLSKSQSVATNLRSRIIWLKLLSSPSLFVNVPFTEKAIASRPRLIVCCKPQICSTFGPRGQFGNLLLRGSDPELDTIKPPILENFPRQPCRLGNKTEQTTSKLENYDPSSWSEWHTQNWTINIFSPNL